MTAVTDPVGTGSAASLARPGGNVTGLSTVHPKLSGMRLEVLREAVPRLSRVAFLWNPEVRGAMLDHSQAEAAAHSLRLQLQSVEVARAEDLDRALSAITKQRAQAQIAQGPNPVTFSNRGKIAGAALRNRLSSMYPSREYADAGGLMSYGPNIAGLFRRTATYVDKILKGAKPQVIQ